MRVNIYAEEITDRVEIIRKGAFTGVRFYLHLPVTINPDLVANGKEPDNRSGPFIHHVGDDDSAAVTFWGKAALKKALHKALDLLEDH